MILMTAILREPSINRSARVIQRGVLMTIYGNAVCRQSLNPEERHCCLPALEFSQVGHTGMSPFRAEGKIKRIMKCGSTIQNGENRKHNILKLQNEPNFHKRCQACLEAKIPGFFTFRGQTQHGRIDETNPIWWVRLSVWP